jgi:hypothetical protein
MSNKSEGRAKRRDKLEAAAAIAAERGCRKPGFKAIIIRKGDRLVVRVVEDVPEAESI